MAWEAHITEAVNILSRARLVAVSSGAGISKESGIPTFREAQTGLWTRYNPEQLATPAAFERNPDLVWSWYMYRYELVREAQPNPGHYALARLEKLVPQLVILTQNVDGLHRLAGSSDVIELHGNLHRFRCSAGCQSSPAIIDLSTIVTNKEQAPACPHCGARIRPDVIWFGEALPPRELERAFATSRACDVIVVVGTSGVVQPAASLPYEARRAGATVIEVNPSPSEVTPLAHLFLQGPSGQVLSQVVDALHAYRNNSPIAGL
jgi:NAD-dependent deacetylase